MVTIQSGTVEVAGADGKSAAVAKPGSAAAKAAIASWCLKAHRKRRLGNPIRTPFTPG
jgi:hypothetical protein